MQIRFNYFCFQLFVIFFFLEWWSPLCQGASARGRYTSNTEARTTHQLRYQSSTVPGPLSNLWKLLQGPLAFLGTFCTIYGRMFLYRNKGKNRIQHSMKKNMWTILYIKKISVDVVLLLCLGKIRSSFLAENFAGQVQALYCASQQFCSVTKQCCTNSWIFVKKEFWRLSFVKFKWCFKK